LEPITAFLGICTKELKMGSKTSIIHTGSQSIFTIVEMETAQMFINE
jgi:hypothetical protein